MLVMMSRENLKEWQVEIAISDIQTAVKICRIIAFFI